MSETERESAHVVRKGACGTGDDVSTLGLQRALAEFLRGVLSAAHPDVDDVTAGISELAAGIPGVDHVGFLLRTERGAARPARTVDGSTAELDRLQATLREGPGIDAGRRERIVRVPDLSRADQWPRFRTAALERTPVRSLVSFQLYTGNDRLGAMTLGSTRVAAPRGVGQDVRVEDAELDVSGDLDGSGDQEQLGVIFAAHAALTVDAVQRTRRHRSALGSRDVIGQAKGMIVGRYDLSADDAFALLTRISAKSHKSVIAIAKEIVDGARCLRT